MRQHHFATFALTFAFVLGCDSDGSGKADAEGKTAVSGAAGAEVAGKTEAKANAEANAKADAEIDAEIDADVDADAKAQADADAEVAAEVVLKPQIGGTIVAAGDYNVEILAFVDGHVEAVVLDAKGELVADMSKLLLVATLAAEGEAKAKVDLAWNAELARFVGEVEAGVQLVPGPVEVAVDVEGKASVGALAELGLAVQASHGGQVMMAGAYSLEVVAKGGAVHVYAFDVAGQAHAKGDLDLDVELDGGAKLDLKWDPPSASYKAEVEGDLDLEAKPIVVELRAEGKVTVAAVAKFHAASAVAVNGAIDARAEVGAPAAKGKLDGSASGKASAKGGAKLEVKKSSSAKASAKTDGGGIKAKAKAKAGFSFGG